MPPEGKLPSWRSIAGTIATVLLALAVWWFSTGTDEEPTSSARGDRSPTAAPSPDLDVTPTTAASDSLDGAGGGGGSSDDGGAGTSSSLDAGEPEEFDAESGLRWVSLGDLPPEAAHTAALIDADGPFPEDEDGSTFQNREGILPDHPRGYYREYTVPTPGAPTRGARRIVTGSDGEFYWTADHYQSFERIRR